MSEHVASRDHSRDWCESSLVLANAGDTTTEALVASGELKQIETIPDLHHNALFIILQR